MRLGTKRCSTGSCALKWRRVYLVKLISKGVMQVPSDDFPFVGAEEQGAQRVSWIALLFTIPFLLLSMACLINQKAALANVNVQKGIHDVLGRPDEQYNLIAAATVLFATPGVLLLARAFFNPSILQIFATLIGGCMFSLILVNLLFGKVDSGLSFIAAVAFLAFVLDFYLYQRERRLYG